MGSWIDFANGSADLNPVGPFPVDQLSWCSPAEIKLNVSDEIQIGDFDTYIWKIHFHEMALLYVHVWGANTESMLRHSALKKNSNTVKTCLASVKDVETSSYYLQDFFCSTSISPECKTM